MLRRWHARTGLAALLVIVASVFAATASAGRASVLTEAPYASPCGVGTSFLDSLAARGGGARGEGREPILNQVLEEVPAGQVQSTANFDATIPVYIHVIRTGTAVAQGNVPGAWIHDQIDVLNMSYAGFYGGADTGFRFHLEDVDRTTNARWFNMTAGGEDEHKAKRALRRGGADALNIYTVDGGKYLGWAYFPSGYASRPHMDGVIMAFGSMPGSTIPGSATTTWASRRRMRPGTGLGSTTRSREVATPRGDHVADTPAEKKPAFGCQVGRDTCLEAGVDPIHNFMDYSDDPCMFEFTAGQGERMQEQYLFFRA
jgi:hypothetical protein